MQFTISTDSLWPENTFFISIQDLGYLAERLTWPAHHNPALFYNSWLDCRRKLQVGSKGRRYNIVVSKDYCIEGSTLVDGVFQLFYGNLFGPTNGSLSGMITNQGSD